jgi:basic membrane protein A and related proteins
MRPGYSARRSATPANWQIMKLTEPDSAPRKRGMIPSSSTRCECATLRVTLLTFLVLALSPASALAEFKLGLVLDRGGKDDKSFNTSAYEGANRAKSKLGVFLKYVEAPDDNAFEPMMRAFALRDFDLIIGVGFAQKEAIQKVAKQFPGKHFAIVDAQVDVPNVRSLMFQEHEGAYVIGAIAALTSKTGKVGFVGGLDIPLIRRFLTGYEAGAKKVNPQAVVLANFVGVTSEAWNNPPKGKELALAQYEAGADVVFAAAGASGLGVFDAAEDKQRFAIGVDANQDGIKPGLILTSMLKRVDEAVFAAIADSQAGKFTGGVHWFGLANKGIDYSFDQYNAKVLTEAVRKRADELKAEIIAGKIVVPDYYKR